MSTAAAIESNLEPTAGFAVSAAPVASPPDASVAPAASRDRTRRPPGPSRPPGAQAAFAAPSLERLPLPWPSAGAAAAAVPTPRPSLALVFPLRLLRAIVRLVLLEQIVQRARS